MSPIEFFLLWFLISFISAVYLNNQSSEIWKQGMEVCKSKNYYLLGNINLSDAKSSCTGLQNSGPGWIGVIKENFVKSDQGNSKVTSNR